jgi:hypothetical protein
MENKKSFVAREAGEVRETLQNLKKHADTIEERLVKEPEDDRLQDFLEDAQEGIEALEPILADFEADGVDPEELVKYAEDLEEWQEKETEIAEYLNKA